jgi:hypothetical protein
MKKKATAPKSSTTDILETMRAELAEGVEILRPLYPEEKDKELRRRAQDLRGWRYEQGRWPTAEELTWHDEKGCWPTAEELAAQTPGA